MVRKCIHFLIVFFILLPMFALTAATAANPLRVGYAQLWPVHAVMMSLSFVVMLFGMNISAFFKKKRWWLALHRRLQLIGTICGIAGFSTAFYMVSVSTGAHFRLLHSIAGLLGIALIIASLTLGYAIFKAKKERKKSVRLLHRWIGRIMLIDTAFTIIMGLSIAGIL
jgi:hypothetical protein